MGRMIADTYELREKLGAGGIGTVYQGWHVRLNEPVVLKAEQRTLKTSMADMRREVDTLKDLSHTYIPKVYDFVVEGDMAYTVMSYIEGEDLNTLLERGERFSQPQVIVWARQLLQALNYLHAMPPHGVLHGDIKPANVMLTPQGDIRLIDFNIALALGEDGAVQVGHSRGYASPEHYGLDYSSRRRRSRVTQRADSTHHSTNGAQPVMLDARSDIYCLGATLYHLLTGSPPAVDAKEVQPIRSPQVSAAVAGIIRKAMDPDPDLRYQTASKMLWDFDHLHTIDPRARRHRLWEGITAAVLAAVFLTGGASALTASRQMQRLETEARQAAEAAEEAQRQAKLAEEAEKKALAAVRRSEQSYQGGNIPEAVRAALEGLAEPTRCQPQAQKALTDALGVYELSDGYRPYLLLELPGQPLKLALSPQGSRAAVLADNTVLVYDTRDGAALAQLPAEPSALSDLVFSDDDTLLYAGAGGVRAYSIPEQRELWSGAPATGLSLSADGSRLAAVDRASASALIYDARTGEHLQEVDFYGLHQSVVEHDVYVDPEDNLFALNADGTLLAASFEGGALWVFDLRDREGDIELYDASGYTHFEGGFFGDYFAFAANGDGSALAVIDTRQLIQTGGLEADMDIHMQTDESGIYVSAGRLVTQLDPETLDESERAYASYAAEHIRTFAVGEGGTILATKDGGFAVFDDSASLLGAWDTQRTCDLVAIAGDRAAAGSWDASTLRLLRREEHQDARMFTYDPAIPHSEARVRADGASAMLFQHDAFQIIAPDGTVLAQQNIPDAEQVYDQQYHREQGYLEVIYNDGLRTHYSDEDGRLLFEKQGDTPDESLYEEFFTDKWKFTSPLHGQVTVCRRDTGETVRELGEDAYLTYVTQAGDYVITQHVSTQGERYGLLLDGECEVLARLPGLCDILEDGTLVFDDDRGNLRSSPVYTLDELIAAGEKQLQEVQT